MTRVITLAREYGSGGREIARRVAERLGWELADRSLLESVARLANTTRETAEAFDERCDTWMARVAKLLWAGSPDTFTGTPVDVLDSDTMAGVTRRVIEEAAHGGPCVIVGRGAQCILAGRPDVLHVFVYADEDERLKRLAARYPTIEEARLAMDQMDRTRAEYVRRYHGCDWRSRYLYDVMINTRVGVDMAAELVLRAAAANAGAA